jgi:hypothetical protein
MYSYNNPYVAKSNHPADDVSAWDFEEDFLHYLESHDYPMQLLGHREAPDTDKYEQEFLDEMAEEWEDAKGEAAYEDMLEERRYDDEKYWDSL